MSRPRKGVKEAVLEYCISASAPDGSASLADITLHTGRTHQIRVQFASRRHPLWGDGKYGSRIKGDIALQSARLRFIHPDTGKKWTSASRSPGHGPLGASDRKTTMEQQYKTDSEIYAVLEREIIDLTLRPGCSLSETRSAPASARPAPSSGWCCSGCRRTGW